jgi:hypothetical protein
MFAWFLLASAAAIGGGAGVTFFVLTILDHSDVESTHAADSCEPSVLLARASRDRPPLSVTELETSSSKCNAATRR